MKDPFRRPILRTGLFYPDPIAALTFLEAAFGFERKSVIWDENEKLVHAEMKFGLAEIVVDGEWIDYVSSPQNLGGKNTQLIYIQLDGGLDGHCEIARSHGAQIIEDPTDQFYGDRTYRAKDIGGHVWTFSQVVKHVSKDEAQKVSGLSIDGWWCE